MGLEQSCFPSIMVVLMALRCVPPFSMYRLASHMFQQRIPI
uniref:Uncharacterized protein n=1 Tax=Arundo donax TaxID=35708 RepID=A0A0A8YFY9_ARUDO